MGFLGCADANIFQTKITLARIGRRIPVKNRYLAQIVIKRLHTLLLGFVVLIVAFVRIVPARGQATDTGILAQTGSIPVWSQGTKETDPYSPEENIRELLNAAGNHYYTSDYRTAYEMLIKALLLCEQYGDTTYEAQIYANMGNIYSRFHKYDMAKREYVKALGLYRDSVGMVAVLNNLGAAELESGRADSALRYMRRALDISTRHDGIHLSSIRNNIARFYKESGRLDSASHYFHLSLDEVRRSNKIEKEAEILSNLSELLLETGQTDSALYYTNLSNEIAIEHKFPNIEAYNYLTLSRIAEAGHSDGRSLAWYKRHVELKDSLFNAEKFGEISQLQHLYDTSKSDARIAALTFEQQIKERTIFYQKVAQAVFLTALAVVLAILVHVFRQKKALNSAYRTLVEKNLQIIDPDLSAGTEKYRKSALSHDRHDELLERILGVMENTGIISDTKFSIDKLSEMVQSNQTYVSQVINETQSKNFRSFLNAYRIREAQRIFSQPDSGKYTIEAVALMVGFLSRTSFRDAFKEETGVTPSFYLKFIREQREA